MFRKFSKNISQRFFSTVYYSHNKVKSLTEQFEEKKKNPEFLKMFNEIQEKILKIKSNLQKHPSPETPELKNDREIAEAEERRSRNHSVF